METGSAISKHMIWAGILIALAFVVMCLSLIADNVYSTVSLAEYDEFQEKGYILGENLALSNVILDGVMHKLTNSTTFTFARYEPFIEILSNEKPTTKMKLAEG